MSDTESFGSPLKPLKIKCTSFGWPTPSTPYICIVDSDGRQFYFQHTRGTLMLHNAQGVDAALKLTAADS